MDGFADSAPLPLHRRKTVHLVRHAEGTHNLEGDRDVRAYLYPEHFDAQLTPGGWTQVEDRREPVQTSGLSTRLNLVVVSPLLRAMQTAVGVFGGEEYTDGINALPLMVANAWSCDHSAISSVDNLPFLAVEKCRERIGHNPCDRRRSVREYRELFPAIDFSLIESDVDILWTDERETIEDLTVRVEEFIEWLWTREENEIAIVTHCVFLDHLSRRFVPQLHPQENELCKTTMQTAVGAFGGEEYTDGINALPLMVAKAWSCDPSAISSVNCPPF